MPHCDRELREIGELLSQIRELLVHVASLHVLLVRNDSARWPSHCKQMA